MNRNVCKDFGHTILVGVPNNPWKLKNQQGGYNPSRGTTSKNSHPKLSRDGLRKNVGEYLFDTLIFLLSIFNPITYYMAFQINNRNNGGISQKKASQAFEVGQFLTCDTDGFLVPGGSGKIVGISNQQVTSASADYAVANDLSFSEATYNDTFIIPVITGTATQTLVGEYVDVDASDPTGVDVTASTNDQILVTRIINSTTIEGKIVNLA